MNELIINQFEGHDFRIRVDELGNPWFAAVDVCEALGIGNSRDAIKNLDEDERRVVSIDTLGGKQELNFLSESGFYNLVFSSRKPEAKRIKKWATSEVLPSIRKTGSYSNKQLSSLDQLEQTLRALIEQDNRTRQ